jgi:N-dimethylarginine dimethylaminohydrolase
MLSSFAPADAAGDTIDDRAAPRAWGVDSEYGRLTDVMLSSPEHLELLPCNPVAAEHYGRGAGCSPDIAAEQHARLIEALTAEGVRCHMVPPVEGLADLAFTRDTSLMTPWGLIALRPAVDHRRAEVEHIRRVARSWEVPFLAEVDEGHVEGGDVCLIRPGLVAIGHSGQRTDQAGAFALARLFERQGWHALVTRFDARFLHLDTVFTLADRDLAVGCLDGLDPDFAARVRELGIDILDVTVGEVQKLGCNLLSLGGKRVLSSPDNYRINALLERRGFKVVRVSIDQFTRCGGGMHCLTMPLARLPG